MHAAQGTFRFTPGDITLNKMAYEAPVAELLLTEGPREKTPLVYDRFELNNISTAQV